MTSPQINTSDHLVTIDRYGHEHHTATLGPTDDRDGRSGVGIEVHHIERRSNNRFDRLARHQVIELPEHRRQLWIHRATTYVDPWEVLAYVGDATGQEAVRLSNDFLQSASETFKPHTEEPETPTPLVLDRNRIRKAISDAYYNARNAGGTMETAADAAADAVLQELGRWLLGLRLQEAEERRIDAAVAVDEARDKYDEANERVIELEVGLAELGQLEKRTADLERTIATP